MAVLRFGRRGGDLSLLEQTRDAIAAVDVLRAETSADLPVVAWDFSHGAWVALRVAHVTSLAGLVLVGASGVSPAVQMRWLAT